LWLCDNKDDIKGPHLDFLGGPQQPFTRLCKHITRVVCKIEIIADMSALCGTQKQLQLFQGGELGYSKTVVK